MKFIPFANARRFIDNFKECFHSFYKSTNFQIDDCFIFIVGSISYIL